jgi:hypothetical protein
MSILGLSKPVIFGKWAIITLIMIALCGCNFFRESKLVSAVEEGNVDKVKALLKEGGNANASDSSGTPLIILASQRGQVAVMDVLIQAGASIEGRGKEGETALIVGCLNGQAQSVKFLLEHKANTSASTSEGATPLIAAVMGMEPSVEISNNPNLAKDFIDNHSILAYLLSSGAPIDPQNKKGMSALMIAAEKGFDTVVKTLRINGAKSNIKANNGQDAAAFAISNGHKQTADLVGSKFEEGSYLGTLQGVEGSSLRFSIRGDKLTSIFLVRHPSDNNGMFEIDLDKAQSAGSGGEGLMYIGPRDATGGFFKIKLASRFTNRRMAFSSFNTVYWQTYTTSRDVNVSGIALPEGDAIGLMEISSSEGFAANNLAWRAKKIKP